MNATLGYLGSVVNGILGGLRAVSGIGRVPPDPIHSPTTGLRKPPFRAGNLRMYKPPEMNSNRWINDHIDQWWTYDNDIKADLMEL